MNEEKIKALQNKLEENSQEKRKIEEKLKNAYYDLLESKGIVKGSKVNIYREDGIFGSLFMEYGSVHPKIMKIKKDGTAHATATIACFTMDHLLNSIDTNSKE